MAANQVEISDAEMVHMQYVMKNGLPIPQRVMEMKQACEKRIAAHATGTADRDALDLLSVLNEWLMIRTDKRLLEAFHKIAAGDVMLEKMKAGGKADS